MALLGDIEMRRAGLPIALATAQAQGRLRPGTGCFSPPSARVWCGEGW